MCTYSGKGPKCPKIKKNVKYVVSDSSFIDPPRYKPESRAGDMQRTCTDIHEDIEEKKEKDKWFRSLYLLCAFRSKSGSLTDAKDETGNINNSIFR